MAPLYKKALIIGAPSGIGASLASKLITNGTKVIVVGRRRDRLYAFVKAHGSDVSSASNLDLDCVVISSGVQRGFNFSQPETINHSLLGNELTTNYTSVVHQTASFLPHLMNEPHGNIIYINATLRLIPAMIRTPNYNASKAALHAFVMSIRYQLRQAGYSLRLVEVFSPAVQTELYDEKNQPDLVNGREIGMPLAEFVDKMYDGLAKAVINSPLAWEDLFKEGGWED